MSAKGVRVHPFMVPLAEPATDDPMQGGAAPARGVHAGLSAGGRLVAALFACVLCACADSGIDQSHLPADRRVETRYSPAVDVDLARMEARPSGLYVQDLVVGDGIRADSGDIARVYYVGRLPNGAEFDSRREGEPLEVALGYGRVIAGWDQGVVGMRVGGRRKLVVPPGLGYGEAGRGSIPGNATLIFDVDLLEVIDRTGEQPQP